MEDKKIGIYVGRFQPFHKWHENVLKQMLKENDTIIIFVGTWWQKAKNPFLFSEVKDFLWWYESDSSFIEEILDHESDEEWVKDLLGILSKYDIWEHTLQFYGGDLDSDSAIRSFKNYISKYYDGWVSYIEIPRDIFLVSIDNNDIALSATLCREALDRWDQNFLEQALPTRVFNNLNKSLL
jgi:cytidyltransferase-like protein